jgi:hypothetical protein
MKSGVWVILLVVIWAALGLPAVGAETQEGESRCIEVLSTAIGSRWSSATPM